MVNSNLNKWSFVFVSVHQKFTTGAWVPLTVLGRTCQRACYMHLVKQMPTRICARKIFGQVSKNCRSHHIVLLTYMYLYSPASPDLDSLFSESDEQLFDRINHNSQHILQQYLPDRPDLNHSLRSRHHNKTLLCKTSELNDRDFIIRNSYKH